MARTFSSTAYVAASAPMTLHSTGKHDYCTSKDGLVTTIPPSGTSFSAKNGAWIQAMQFLLPKRHKLSINFPFLGHSITQKV